MPRRRAKKIVEEIMPGMEVVQMPVYEVPDSVKKATQPGPSMAELRKKYLGLAVEEATRDIADASLSIEEHVEVTQVRNKKSPADPADDPGPRTIIVDQDKGIIGSQG
jgi:hypothetical protein